MTGPVDLEFEYDNRARVPEHPANMAGWQRDAAAYCAARSGRAELGLCYGPHSRHVVDLFHPDSADPVKPIIAFIHGGYWRGLDPSQFSHLAAGANAHGYLVAMPGYRLCPEVGLGDIIEDVRDACRFLHGQFRRPIVACGHSAGGHLAAALAATDWAASGPAVPNDLVRRGLAISGIFDLRPLLATSINQTLGLIEETAERDSPALWPPPPGVRLELWVGEHETSEYFRQSRQLADAWRANGPRMEVRAVPGANHFTAPAPLADPDSPLTRALVELCMGGDA